MLLFDSYQGMVEQRTGIHRIFRALSYKKDTDHGVINYTIKYYIGDGQINIVKIAQPPAFSNEQPEFKQLIFPNYDSAVMTKIGMTASALVAIAMTLV